MDSLLERDAPDGLVISLWSHGPLAIVTLAGELDMASAPQLAACLAEQTADVRVDCSDLEFIDSSGLQVFVVAHRLLASRGRQLVISGLSEQCRRPFEITKLDAMLTLTA
jgi:anti-anti-sigma factor